ncbi:UDP-N-acetylmuramoylalanine--D-glutamate ligase [Thermosinus carboxydivorans Nor1]|uniref:UDP-N-acetylmuramoylalanine--D-glutamate ligase n=1 Tax=Thermosinus carboxydivorans Nor1 TaxID=401526 RepID=A1HU53_9FIRM|nr:UDP-N-acetylmuramoyl-L-alanine--D-glutamate ligase [Thermosinus carboxydivorans]EAX46437.1 UDP-N-acetylmuramoylalanine--D-glutamate ligase [Thermosinus carboxydivorans Nor1]
MTFAGMNIAVLGAGVSGISVAQVLRRLGAHVILSDAKAVEKPEFAALRAAGVRLELGYQDESLLTGVDLLVLSPGVSIYNPLVEAAQVQGIPVMSEIEVAYRLCPAPIIAITGTNGKTTTTTLVGEMLKAAGREVVVGGNIGLALSQEVAGISEHGIVVAEISSFQLEGVVDFRPRIAAVLNLTPDHLDRHRSLDNYKAMKERIFRNQRPDDYLVLNYDDPLVRDMAERAPSQAVFFSRKARLSTGARLEDETIVMCWEGKTEAICPVKEMKLFGAHNIENALAASCVAFLAGADAGAIGAVLRTFMGVEHRIEPVAEIRGVRYYNDSKATNPESAIKALEAFDGHIILIAGGRDKKTDLTEFMELAKQKVDHLILLGEAKERFYQAAAAHGVTNIHLVDKFEDAVTLAYRLARPPQVVLLSPACASYDMFNNYEERGRVFKELVRQLK